VTATVRGLPGETAHVRLGVADLDDLEASDTTAEQVFS
jgi:hypothetical protein